MKNLGLAVFCATVMLGGLGKPSHAFLLSNLPAEGEVYHPADVNADWHLVLNEAIAYLAGWQQGGNPMNYAIRAAYLWQNGEYYLYNAEEMPPLCWTFPTPAEGEPGEGEAPAEGEGEADSLIIGAVYGNWASDSYPYSVCWRRQTYSTSQAVTHVDYTEDTPYAGAGSLAFTVNAEAGSEHTNQGEVYVDLRYPPAYEADQALIQQFQNGARVGVDLSNTTMSFHIFCPAGTSGSFHAPNGIQLFLLSLEVDENENESWYAAYADWHNIIPATGIPLPGEILEDQWTAIQVDMSDMASFGYVDPNFDATKVVILGVKYGLNEHAVYDVLDQTLLLDEFVIEDENSVLAHFTFDFVKDPIQALTDNDFNTVAVLVTQYMDSLSATDIHPVPGKTHSDGELAVLLQLLQEREIPVVFKPHVDIQDEDDSWRGLIAHDTPQDKEAWFADYTDFVVHYATLCEAYGVETFVIGTEYETLVGIENKTLWEGVINAVRSVFSGAITYASNWDAYQNVSFWDSVDVVGIDAYFPLSYEADPSLQALKAGWEYILWEGPEDEAPRMRNWLDELRLFQTQVNKSVLFTEIGYRSTDYAAHEPWEYEEIRPINTDLQHRAYQAFYEVFSQEVWFDGFFVWHVQPAKDDGGPWCSNFTPLNKPALGAFKKK